MMWPVLVTIAILNSRRNKPPVDPIVMLASADIDWRKCKKCGWTGTPREAIQEGRRLVDEESGECSSFTVQLCPDCRKETYYDRDRAKRA